MNFTWILTLFKFLFWLFISLGGVMLISFIAVVIMIMVNYKDYFIEDESEGENETGED